MKRWIALLSALLTGSIIGNIWAVRRVLRPIRNLAAQARQLAQGDMSALEHPCGGIHEVRDLRYTMASMAQHVQRAQAEGLIYRHALTDGQEAERARLAHELHDETVQSLVAIAQSIEMAGAWIESDPQRAKATLGMARAEAIDSVNNLRRLIADLRPPALEELGISAALKMLASSAENAKFEVNVYGFERRIGDAHELALFRIAQEAIRNAEKHGQPNRIALDLTFDSNAIRLIACDDGIGFTPPESFENFAQRQHFGLLGIQERVQQLNGDLKILSRPAGGTVIDVVLPLNEVEQPAERVRDPVCGAFIEPQRAFGSAVHKGETYYFCCPVCQGAFKKDPLSYVGISTAFR
jgi:signal transduction histidine kinase/YHS domain-containing protein